MRRVVSTRASRWTRVGASNIARNASRAAGTRSRDAIVSRAMADRSNLPGGWSSTQSASPKSASSSCRRRSPAGRSCARSIRSRARKSARRSSRACSSSGRSFVGALRPFFGARCCGNRAIPEKVPISGPARKQNQCFHHRPSCNRSRSLRTAFAELGSGSGCTHFIGATIPLRAQRVRRLGGVVYGLPMAVPSGGSQRKGSWPRSSGG